MNRQKAYRKLMSWSASSRPKIHEVYEDFAFHKMAERPRSIPIVKLKIGEPLSNQKRGRSVAELNNIRSNYSHYCHYRINGKKEFPPVQARTSSAPSPIPSPSRDGTVIFMLRGTQRRQRHVRKISGTSQQTRSATPAPPTTAPASPGFSGHLIVKRKDSSPAAPGPPCPPGAPVAAASIPMTPIPRTIDVNTPPLVANSTSDGIDGYELRGSSLLKSNTSLREEEELMAYAQRASMTGTRITAGIDRVISGSTRFIPRPGSYVTSKRSQDLFCYENEKPGVRYDHRAMYQQKQMASRSGQRKVRFDHERTPANVSTYIFPMDERVLRLQHSHQPLQLTQKNLEIFDYLHNPHNNPVVTSADDQNTEKGHAINRRVFDWVQERQLDMTSLLREVASENDIAGLGLATTPEVNETNGVNDSDDPDLEVYDLTKEEDFLPHDEVIDAVVDDMSCE